MLPSIVAKHSVVHLSVLSVVIFRIPVHIV